MGAQNDIKQGRTVSGCGGCLCIDFEAHWTGAATDLVADLLHRYVGRAVDIEHVLSLADVYTIDGTFAELGWCCVENANAVTYKNRQNYTETKMLDDYRIRVAGVRELLMDWACSEAKGLDVDDMTYGDEGETDLDKQIRGGYTDVWIGRNLSALDRSGKKPALLLAGIRVHPQSGPTYQALMPNGHPRRPRHMVSGEEALTEASAIFDAAVASNAEILAPHRKGSARRGVPASNGLSR